MMARRQGERERGRARGARASRGMITTVVTGHVSSLSPCARVGRRTSTSALRHTPHPAPGLPPATSAPRRWTAMPDSTICSDCAAARMRGAYGVHGARGVQYLPGAMHASPAQSK